MPSVAATAQPLIREINPRSGDPITVTSATAFVGTNSSGNIEALRDILQLAANFHLGGGDTSDGLPETTVLKDVTLQGKLTVDRLLQGLHAEEDAEGELSVQGFGPDIETAVQATVGQDIKNILRRPSLTARSVVSTALGAFMPLRALFLPATNRTGLAGTCPVGRPDDTPVHLLQALQDSPQQVHEDLQTAYAEAYPGEQIRLDDSSRVELCLRVAAEFSDEARTARERLQELAACRRLEEVGYGRQSFVTIVLGTLLSPGRFILIEEPEQHLHPEAARHLGRWLAEHAGSENRQVFVSTHSEPFLAGLFDHGEPVTVVQTSSVNGVTHLTALPPEVARSIGVDPQFTHQRSLNSVFSDGIVIVPDSADALVYETVAARYGTGRTRVRFLHAVGQSNLPAMAALLRKTELPLGVVTGMELFQNEQQFCELVSAASGAEVPRPWLATRERLAAHLEGGFSESALANNTQEVEQFLEQYQSGELSGESPAGGAATPATIAWRQLGTQALNELPPELSSWVEDLLEDLKQQGIYVAPKPVWSWFLRVDRGEQGHWLTRALECFRQDEVPADLIAFVNELTAIVNHAKAASKGLLLSGRSA